MIKIKQGLIFSLILLTGCASTEVKKEQSKAKTASLNNAQITTLLVGKTMIGSEGWTDKFNADGTVDSIYKGKASKGKYLIKNGMLCTMFKNNRCRTITKTANGYLAKLVSGGGRSFNFTVK